MFESFSLVKYCSRRQVCLTASDSSEFSKRLGCASRSVRDWPIYRFHIAGSRYLSPTTRSTQKPSGSRDVTPSSGALIRITAGLSSLRVLIRGFVVFAAPPANGSPTYFIWVACFFFLYFILFFFPPSLPANFPLLHQTRRPCRLCVPGSVQKSEK